MSCAHYDSAVTYIHVYHIHMHTLTAYICIHTHTYLDHLYICIYTHTNTHTHTYKHTLRNSRTHEHRSAPGQSGGAVSPAYWDAAMTYQARLQAAQQLAANNNAIMTSTANANLLGANALPSHSHSNVSQPHASASNMNLTQGTNILGGGQTSGFNMAGQNQSTASSSLQYSAGLPQAHGVQNTGFTQVCVCCRPRHTHTHVCVYVRV
jgi:hypothetical protein